MKLILAEKPSVAKNIADALQIKTKKDGYYEGNDYVITWAFGHLVELYDAKDYDSKMAHWKLEHFPFIPTKFKYKIKSKPYDRSKTDAGAAKQIKIIQTLMRRQNVDMIISACDYDREGQLIGDSIIYRGERPNKPVYRLLLNEWTKEEVLRGLNQIRSNEEMRPLRDAGISRQWADWVIGINLTSVATLKFLKGRGKALNIGRVLLPTLKIIYDRDEEIANFQPEDYFKLTATFMTDDNKHYEGTYTEDGKDKFTDKDKLTNLSAQLQGKEAIIVDKEVNKKKEFPPFLFNLSNLQGYITNKYKGWTSDKVLKVAQSLYEKKLITYPRTSSIALEESLVKKAAHVLKVHSEDVPYKSEIKFMKTKRVFNNAKVESHSAIIPTYVKPKRLTADENIVYTAIKNRFIMQFMPVAIFEETIISTKVQDDLIRGYFLSKGKVQLVEGWKKLEKITSKEVILPVVEKNQEVRMDQHEVTSHVTKPPKPHTEKTLLRVMETCGRNLKEDDAYTDSVLKGFSIGTAATRAETIKKLKDIGYIVVKGKNLHCTSLGKKLVEIFPVKQLFDLEFTGRLEKVLADIQRGQEEKDAFLEEIYQFTRNSVDEIKRMENVTIETVTTGSKEILGNCPQCGGQIIEGHKGFGCSNWKKGCKYVIWKNDKFLATMKKKPTKTMVKQILRNNRAYVRGLTSKKGKKFNAYLSYEKNKNGDYFSWKMEFKK